MLPEGFHWARRWQYAKGANAVWLDSCVVCWLGQRIDGQWFARLDCHAGIDAPLRIRTCTDYATGRAGCELWVARHEARLRAEVAAIEAKRPYRRWAVGARPPTE